jgi:ABC-type Na+ transport system ATPase subunit NatA
MEFEIVIKNYRCFPDENPASLRLGNGFIVLLGQNNSGKTALLRFFYEFRGLFARLAEDGIMLQALRGEGVLQFSRVPTHDMESIFAKTNNRPLTIEINPSGAPSAAVELTLQRGNPYPVGTCKARLMIDGAPVPTAEMVSSGNLVLWRSRQLDLDFFVDAFRRISRTIYIPAFRNAVNAGAAAMSAGTPANYFDIDVGQAFVQRWREYQTGDSIKRNELTFRVVQDIGRIFGFRELQIHASADMTTLQLIVDGKSYRLEELGSGLAQFVLTLGNVATRECAYILIDEPELGLHPTLQIDFLMTLASFAEEGVLFSTHSVGLARATADSIYALIREDDGRSRVTPFEQITTNLSEFLGELSYSGFTMLGFSTILLVEGSSEVKTFQQLLRWIKRDHEVVLLPLGGNQLINRSAQPQLEEMKRITSNIIAIIDSERTTAGDPLSADRAGFAEACQKANIPCHVLDRRAIENYFSDAAIKKVKGDKYRALGPYERLRDANPAWAKSENWRIVREMKAADLENTDLGQFVEHLRELR